MYYLLGMEIKQSFRGLSELEIQFYVSKWPVIEFNAGDGTKWVRETSGFEHRYWMIFPESAHS
jgi:hypothetical protein